MKTSTKMVAFLRRISVLSMLLVALVHNAKAQISVSGAGALNGTYTTFTNSSTGLFAALNASNQTGNNIVVSVTANVTEPTTGVALTGVGGMWSSLTIKPSGGAWTISAAATTDLIDFSGASNVTIDGLNSGGNALTISNTTAGSVATIRFINDANNIKIKNCTITGSANASQKAVVMFATGTTTGNDNIRISGCDIGPAGTNYPTNCIFSLGTSITVDNSSDTLDNNKVHDFYSNTLPSFGIHLNNTNASSSNNWLIDNNKLYQTASRSYGTANTHQIIVLGTGAGHVCSNNIIGYASSTGTGTYTISSGTGATRLVGISVNNSDVGGTPISVQGNIITGFSVTSSNSASTTTATFIGINLNAGNANIGTVTGNTIGATTGTGSLAIIAAASGGGAVAICNQSSGTINISNNNIGSMSVSASTATFVMGLYGIYTGAISTSLTINNNTIGNSIANNMVAGTSGVTTGTISVGGIIGASVPTTLIISNNTIRNFTNYSTGTSSYVRGITSGTTGVTTSASIFNNTIYNLSTAGLLAGASSGQTCAQGIQLGSGLNARIYGNTIYNISSTNTSTSTSNIIVSGIGLTGAQSTSVYNNKIYGLSNANTGITATAPPMAVGIVIRAGTTNDSIYNNMISLGNGQTGNTVFVGILGNHGSSPDPISYIFHNTINIEGTAASGALPSFCLHRGDFSTTARTQTYIIKNNIFTNSRTGGTGKHYAIGNNFGGSSSTTNLTSDYNILNSANTSTVAYSSASDLTFAGWQTAVSGDANSFTAATVTYTNSSNDLHINMGTSNNFIESYGDANVMITTDFDGQVRPGPAGSVNGGAVAPDLGADEFDGHLTYTCITPIATTVNASVNPVTCYGSATILSLNSQASYTGSGYQYQWQVSSNNTSFTDISGATLPTYSAVPNTTTTYYRCIVTCPAGPSTITSSSITITAPTIMAGGTYTINSGIATGGSNYNTFTEAINDLNCRGISGPIVINVTSGTTYNEQVTLNQVAGANAVNTITINGNGATLSFNSTVSTARAGITLNGADYVTIDNLIIDASAGTYGWGVLLTNGADYNTISNSTINVSTTSTTSTNHYPIVISGSTTSPTTSGVNGSNNTFTGNILSGGYYGIVMYGSSTVSSYNTNNKILNNTITGAYLYSIYCVYQKNATISGNDISRSTRSTISTTAGVYFSTGGGGNLIEKNRIHNMFDAAVSTNTSTFYGIYVAADGTLGAENKIINNLIYNITNSNGSQYGLYNSGAAYYQAYHNTIILNGTTSTAGLAYGIYQTTAVAGIEYINNLVYITRGGTGTKRCIYFATTTSTITSSNNNLYINPSNGTDYAVGNFGTTVFTTIADWKTANSNAYDQNSVSVNPQFVDPSNNDFTPNAGAMDDLGTNVGVTTDITGNSRSGSTPDIGAIEFTGAGCTDPPTPGNVTSSTAFACTGVNFTLDVTGNSSGPGQTYQWEISTDNTNWSNLGSSSTSASYITSQTTSHYYRLGMTCSGGSTVYTPGLLVTTLASINGVYTIDKNAPVSSTNFQSITDAVNSMVCGITGPVTFNVVANSGPYNEQVTIPVISGTSTTNTVTFNGNGNTISFNSTNTSARAGFTLNGADYIKINNFDIDGSAGTYAWGVHLTNGADYNTVSNCTINVGANVTTTNYGGIIFSNSVSSPTTSGNSGNYDTIIGNRVIGGYYGISLYGNSTGNCLNNSVINNIVEDAYTYNIYSVYQNGALIKGNEVKRVNRTTFTTSYCIYLSTSTTNSLVEQNKIHDVYAGNTSNTSATYVLYGSGSPTAGNENIFRNNLVYNIDNSGTVYSMYFGTNYIKSYHNTIVLDNVASTAGSTYGLYQSSSYTNLDVKNNLVYITRGGSGTKACLYISSAGTSNSYNNNNYYINAPAGTNYVAQMSSTYTTLAAWQAGNANGYDANSVSMNPGFTSAITGDFKPTSNAFNNLGTPVGVAYDLYDSVRSSSTPDIGAIEFDIPTCSGTPTSGNVYVSSSIVCSNDNFTLDLVGQTTGLGITYQWQSSTNNSTWSNIGTAADVTSYITSQTSSMYYRCEVACNASNFAYTPSVQIVSPSLISGTFTIDANTPTGGTNFQTFAEAVSYISCGINGPVTFNVVANSGPYAEQVNIPAINGTSSTNTITINGNGNTISFNSTNTSNRAGITLNGADYVTIDNLNINGTSGTYGWGVLLTNQADYNTISNCTIDVGENATSSNFAGIIMSASFTSATTTGTVGNNNTITNNTIIGGYYGVTACGGSANIGMNNTISNNILRDQYFYPSYNTYQSGELVSNNDIFKLNRTTYTTAYGCYLTTGVTNSRFEKNKIHYVFGTATTGTSVFYGFYVAGDGTAGNENKIINNLIYDINNNGTNYGIYNTTGAYMQAYHNTIVFDGTAATTGTTYGIYQTGAIAGFDIRNNNIYITRSGTGIKRCLHYATTTSTITSNNNNLYLNAASGTDNNIATFGTTAYATLTNWKTANSGAFDQNSVSVDPGFVNPASANYRPTASAVNTVGANVGVTNDINGDLRGVTFTAGAYQNDVTAPTISYTNLTEDCGPSQSSSKVLSNVTISDLNGVATTGGNTPRIYYKKGVNGSWGSSTGSLTSGNATNGNWSFTINYSNIAGLSNGDSIYYYIVAQDLQTNVGSLPSGIIATSVNNVTSHPTGNYFRTITYNPTITISTASTTVCSGSNVTFTSSITDGGSSPAYVWRKNGFNVGSGSSIGFLAGTLSNNDVITCELTANNTCQTSSTANSNSVVLTVNPSPVIGQITNSVGTVITTATMCTLGSSVRYFDTTYAGTWSSSNPAIASVTSQGVVTSNSNGVASISYSKSSNGGCVSSSSVQITVAKETTPNAITGNNSICVGSTTTLSNTTSGGVWSSSNVRGTINNSGVYTGNVAGTGEVRYTTTNANGCSAYVLYPVIVNAIPNAPTINYASGTVNPQAGAPSGSYCVGKVFTVVGTPSGGVWTSTGVASITSGGVVTIISTGVGSIKYTYTTAAGCTSSRTINGNGFTCAARGVELNNESQKFDFSLYPNPAKSKVNLSVETMDGTGKIVISDIYGKELQTQNLSLGNNLIDISKLSKGLYFISTVNNEGKTTKKLIIE